MFYRFINYILGIFSTDYMQCELCSKPTKLDNFSYYYEDVHACKRCCPDGYRDYEAEALADKIP